MKAIECKNISKTFWKTKALDKVNLTFARGTITCLLGPNGAGKSTLLNIITDRLFADEGRVLIDGLESKNNMAAQEKVFLMSEVDVFAFDRKVKEILAVTQDLRPAFSIQEAYRIADLFEIPLKKTYMGLSTGMKTMVKLTLALASGADYLLFDEPVLGLDANNRDLFYRLLLEKFADHEPGIVLSTHLIDEVEDIINHVAIIDGGKVIESGSIDAILSGLYAISGEESALDAWIRTKDLKVLAQKQLGGQKKVVLNLKDHGLPANFSQSPLSLEEYFVCLTQNDF